MATHTTVRQCHVNTISAGPGIGLFPHLCKIKSLRSYGYVQIFFFDLRKNFCNLTDTIALT